MIKGIQKLKNWLNINTKLNYLGIIDIPKPPAGIVGIFNVVFELIFFDSII